MGEQDAELSFKNQTMSFSGEIKMGKQKFTFLTDPALSCQMKNF